MLPQLKLLLASANDIDLFVNVALALGGHECRLKKNQTPTANHCALFRNSSGESVFCSDAAVLACESPLHRLWALHSLSLLRPYIHASKVQLSATVSMTMVCDVCNVCHGSRFHGHGSPPELAQIVHAVRKKKRGVASLDQFCRRHVKKPYDIKWRGKLPTAMPLGFFRSSGSRRPIRKTTGLVYAAVLEEGAFAADVSRTFDTTARSRCSCRRRSIPTVSVVFHQLL